MLANYHTHTFRCKHAKGKDEEYVLRAIEGGLKVLGFSDHAPINFVEGYDGWWRVQPEDAEEYINSLRKLREKYKDKIKIHIGFEMEYFPEYFDKILIDAPCSGEGMFRKEKRMVKAWEEHGPEFFAKIQRSIVTQAARMLKPGGMMLYSTCTFDQEENEGTIEYLLEQYPEFRILEMAPYEGFGQGKPEVTKSKSEDFKKTVRIWPHKMHGEGHYVALLQKGDALANTSDKFVKAKAKKVPEEILEFFEDIDWKMDWSRLEIYSEKVYYMPEGIPDVKGIRFLRTGLYLGDLKKNRFEPSQSLAMCLKKEEYKNIINIPVEDERIVKYLKGETIDVDDIVSRKAKGWQLVLVDGYPLGWGKLANGTLKNKYLPGWRWMS